MGKKTAPSGRRPIGASILASRNGQFGNERRALKSRACKVLRIPASTAPDNYRLAQASRNNGIPLRESRARRLSRLGIDEPVLGLYLKADF
jgi:hypothetical protein